MIQNALVPSFRFVISISLVLRRLSAILVVRFSLKLRHDHDKHKGGGPGIEPSLVFRDAPFGTPLRTWLGQRDPEEAQGEAIEENLQEGLATEKLGNEKNIMHEHEV